MMREAPTSALLMSASNSTTLAGPVAAPHPAVGPALILLLVGTIGTAFLIPLIFILLLHPHRTRPRVLSCACLFAIVLGIMAGVINIGIQTQTAQGLPFSSGLDLVFFALALCIPIIVQVGLLLRITSVYRWGALSWTRRLAFHGASVTLKVVRIALVILSIHDAYVGVPKLRGQGRTDSFLPWVAAWNTDHARLAWVLQLVDDIHASTLLTIRSSRRARGGLQSSLGISADHEGSSGSIRLVKSLVSTFAIPVLLDIVQLILVFTYDPQRASFQTSSVTDHDYANLLPIYFVLATTYAEIISLIFVALWHCVTPALVPRRPSYPIIPMAPTTGHLDLYPPPGPGSDPFNASRALSPLPSYPRIHLSHMSYGSAGTVTHCGSGSLSSSATLHPDSEWRHSFRAGGLDGGDPALEMEKEKILASTAGTGLFRPGMFEPSVCSYNGSVQVDAHGEPVFYAV
ncbi:hypothetical protein C8Q78DRAFT_231456 [Trametes maxima]|nr:hypothetical protein C8Q78DRAFT_231456 [Trametes maxima]